MNTVEELNKIEEAQALYYSWEDEYEEYCDSQDENDEEDEEDEDDDDFWIRKVSNREKYRGLNAD